jgi:hypothetical protein
MIRLTDEQWERMRMLFPEEHIPDGRPRRKPIPNASIKTFTSKGVMYSKEGE